MTERSADKNLLQWHQAFYAGLQIELEEEADKLKEYMGDAEKDSMKKDLAVQKAVDLIMENIKERAKPKSKKEKDEAAESAE